MKRIVFFEHVNLGIREGMDTPIKEMNDRMVGNLHNGFAAGVGTDAESALDDMLRILQEQDYDITGLEGQIKDFWNPMLEEGNGCDFWYHFGIVFKFTRS